MNAHLSMAQLFKTLLPLDHHNGWLGMIRAYFDDSGTHTGGKWGPSKIVLVAGIFGTEARMDSLDRNWKKLIDRPLCGRKPPLSRFHMVDCQDSRGEFTGWTRTETDHFCHQLSTAIIESGVAAYGIAVSRQDWDDLVTGDVRAFVGDAEGYCISQCFVRAVRWAKTTTFDPQMTFIFDNREPEVERRAKTVGDAFEKHTDSPHIVGTAFLGSKAILPLQAADLIAWEIYQHARQILADGVIAPPKRPSLRRLGTSMPFNTQIALRPAIQQIVDHIGNSDPEFLEAAAHHFTNFDPSNPDYSYLSKKK